MRKRRGEVRLSEALDGRLYTVTSLHERDPKLLLFLHQAGIGPGKKLRVVRQNYDQTVAIEIPAATAQRRAGAKEEAGTKILGRPAAEAVWLKPERGL